MRCVSQGFCFAFLLIGCSTLVSCVSDDAAVRTDMQQAPECTRYRVSPPGLDPETLENRSRFETQNRDHPYYGPPPFTPVDPQSPVPVVSCVKVE